MTGGGDGLTSRPLARLENEGLPHAYVGLHAFTRRYSAASVAIPDLSSGSEIRNSVIPSCRV